MPRIVGVDLPENKIAEVALTYIYGIGKTSAKKILEKCDIPPYKKMKNLSQEELEKIKKEIEYNYKVEGLLRAEIKNNIKKLIEINSWRGLRHKAGLPVRGQRTRTNARTRKGPKKEVIPIKKKGKIGKKG